MKQKQKQKQNKTKQKKPKTKKAGGMYPGLLIVIALSVATVMTDVFQINQFSMRIKIGEIAKVFVKIEDPEN